MLHLTNPSFHFHPQSFTMNQTKATQRFKRVTKPIKSICKTPTINDPKSLITKVRPKRNPKSKLQFDDAQPTASNPLLLEKFSILTPDFYQIDALDLAPRLLGKYLRRDDVVLQITEVTNFYHHSKFFNFSHSIGVIIYLITTQLL